MRPTEILMHEHRLIERVLDCLERLADAARSPAGLDAAAARDALAFLREFADACHHGKEEDQLFPVLESRGLSAEAGPTAVMRHEHRLGRALIGRMSAAVDDPAADGAAAAFAGAADEYVALLREHIRKEDHCLFPLADRALGPADEAALLERFERAEREAPGPDALARYTPVAEDLERRVGVAAGRAEVER